MPSTRTPSIALAAWRAELAASRRSPWLATLVLRHATAIARRAAAIHARLAALPRRTRRQLARVWAMALPVAALVLAWSGGAAEAATITVGDGCTLVDAIHAANGDEAVGGCAAGSGADTVVLGGGTYTYREGAFAGAYDPVALPSIASPITIEGNGARIERSAASEENFLLLEVLPEGDVSLHDLSLVGGGREEDPLAGPFDGNQYGGVILNRGRLHVERCTITDGRADRGGAIANGGDAKVITSRIEHNAARDAGGGLYSGLGFGDEQHLEIRESEISENVVGGQGGGVSSYYGTLIVRESTISRNRTLRFGGGILTGSESSAELHDVLVQGNYAGAKWEDVRYGQGGGIWLNGPVQVRGGRLRDNEALLNGGALFLNGGTGEEARVDLDDTVISGNRAQRGGAVFGWMDLSVEGGAILDNHAEEGGGLYLEAGELRMTGTRLEGNRATTLGGAIRASARSMHLRSLQVSRNSAGGDGGGLAVWSEDFVLEDSVVTGNVAGERGGGLYLGMKAARIESALLTENAADQGGGMYAYDNYPTEEGELLLRRSELRDNVATVRGGGLATEASATIRESMVANNTAGEGGGLSLRGRSDVERSLIVGNRAETGAGLWHQSTSPDESDRLLALNSTFSANRASVAGGGLASLGVGKGVVVNSTLVGNQARSGGAVLSEGRELLLVGSILTQSEGGDCAGRFDPGVQSNLIDDHGSGACAELAEDAVTGLSPALDDHGGPTDTFALLPGSNAIDAMDECVEDPVSGPISDQRGAVRPQDGDGDGRAACDVGAFEVVELGSQIYLPLGLRP